jgi:hypothetical protein
MKIIKMVLNIEIQSESLILIFRDKVFFVVSKIPRSTNGRTHSFVFLIHCDIFVGSAVVCTLVVSGWLNIVWRHSYAFVSHSPWEEVSKISDPFSAIHLSKFCSP